MKVRWITYYKKMIGYTYIMFNIPPDCIRYIASYLDYSDIVSLTHSCSELCKYSEELNRFPGKRVKEYQWYDLDMACRLGYREIVDRYKHIMMLGHAYSAIYSGQLSIVKVLVVDNMRINVNKIQHISAIKCLKWMKKNGYSYTFATIQPNNKLIGVNIWYMSNIRSMNDRLVINKVPHYTPTGKFIRLLLNYGFHDMRCTYKILLNPYKYLYILEQLPSGIASVLLSRIDYSYASIHKRMIPTLDNYDKSYTPMVLVYQGRYSSVKNMVEKCLITQEQAIKAFQFAEKYFGANVIPSLYPQINGDEYNGVREVIKMCHIFYELSERFMEHRKHNRIMLVEYLVKCDNLDALKRLLKIKKKLSDKLTLRYARYDVGYDMVAFIIEQHPDHDKDDYEHILKRTADLDVYKLIYNKYSKRSQILVFNMRPDILEWIISFSLISKHRSYTFTNLNRLGLRKLTDMGALTNDILMKLMAAIVETNNIRMLHEVILDTRDYFIS